MKVKHVVNKIQRLGTEVVICEWGKEISRTSVIDASKDDFEFSDLTVFTMQPISSSEMLIHIKPRDY